MEQDEHRTVWMPGNRLRTTERRCHGDAGRLPGHWCAFAVRTVAGEAQFFVNALALFQSCDFRRGVAVELRFLDLDELLADGFHAGAFGVREGRGRERLPVG